jgi:hypothetical protein
LVEVHSTVDAGVVEAGVAQREQGVHREPGEGNTAHPEAGEQVLGCSLRGRRLNEDDAHGGQAGYRGGQDEQIRRSIAGVLAG